MATRLYYTWGTAPISPSFTTNYAWQDTDEATRQLLSPIKLGGDLQAPSAQVDWIAKRPCLITQFVSPPLVSGQTIDGSLIKSQIRAREFASDDEVRTVLSIWIAQPNGALRAQVLKGGPYGTGAELAAGADHVNRKWATGANGVHGSSTAQAGDYLVVDIGVLDLTGSTPQAQCVFGSADPGTLLPFAGDLPEDETSTSDAASWIEFDESLVFEPIGWVGSTLLLPHLDAAGETVGDLEGTVVATLPTPGLVAGGVASTEIVADFGAALPLPTLRARPPRAAVSASLKPYLTSTAAALDLGEALALGRCDEMARVFLMSGAAATGSLLADLWPPGANMSYPTVATVVSVSSSSAQDSAGGDGARVVEIVGWDEDWDLTTETLALDGATAVTTVAAFWRVLRVRVVGVGSAGKNAGTLALTIDATTAAVVPAGSNASVQPHFTVPVGHLGYVYDWRVSAAKGGGQIDRGAIRFQARPKGEVFFPVEEVLITGGGGLSRSGPLYVAEAETDLTVRAWSAGAGSDRWVASSYSVAVFPAL